MAGYMDLISKAGKSASGGKKGGRGNRVSHIDHGGRDDSQRASSMLEDDSRSVMRDPTGRNTRPTPRDMRKTDRG